MRRLEAKLVIVVALEAVVLRRVSAGEERILPASINPVNRE
jgi:hypothetical protein